jgi:uncharacterized membrane protein YfcA
VHWRRGTVHQGLVRWLVLGSIPSAFLGVYLLRKLGSGPSLQEVIRLALGAALLIVCAGLLVRPLLFARRAPDDGLPPQVRPLPTLLVGVAGGLVVGLTSVGSGSLMIILLLVLYPRLSVSQLVGTDLVQAVPLVASAAIAHLLFGDFQFGLTASILIGSIPGVFIGAHFSSRAPDHAVRPALVVVLLVSGLKLAGAPNAALAIVVPVAVISGVLYGLLAERRIRAARRPVPGTRPTVETVVAVRSS